MKGWIKLYRQIWNNPYFADPDFVSVWVWLLCNVTHEPKDVLFKGKRISLTPGQLTTGRKIMAKATGVHESKIHRVLDLLKNEQQIEQQTSNSCRLITIKNWDRYQINEQQSEQPVNNHRTTDEQPVNTKQEYKEYKNISTNVDIHVPTQKTEKAFRLESSEYLLSILLLELIRVNNPKFKAPDLQKWAAEIDKMLRLDFRTVEEVEFIIRWAQASDFWKRNILSAAKLREKFDQLWIQAKGKFEEAVEKERKTTVPHFDNPYAHANN